MWALEVRPVALHPVIAGIRRRDHLGLRRVSRDGAGSDRRGRGTGLALPKGGASSAAPRRRFRLRSACGPRGRASSRHVSAWALSRPSGLPLLGFSKVLNRVPRFRLSAARTVAGPSRGSRVASLVAALHAPSGSRLQVPAEPCVPPHVGLAPPSTSASYSRLLGLEVATSCSELALPCCTPEGACAAELSGRSGCQSAHAGVPSSSFLTTSTVSPHLTCRTSPCLRLAGSPRLRDLPSLRLHSRSRALTRSRWRLQQTSPCRAPPHRPGGRWFVRSSRSWGSSSFRAPPPGGRAAWRRFPCGFVHSLDALLPLGAFTPCRRVRSPSQLTIRLRFLWSPRGSVARLPVARFTRPHAPLVVVSSSWIAPASHAIARLRRRGLSATHARFRSPHRLRVASSGTGRLRVSAPLSLRLDLRVLPQGADRPVALPRPKTGAAHFRCAPWACALCVVWTVRLIRRHHTGYRRSPSSSHSGALVPVSRATHAWSASPS